MQFIKLLCDDCNRGFHIFCLVPVLNEIPKEAWFCDECKRHSLEEKNDEDEEESLRTKKYKEMKMSIVESETKKRREHLKNTEIEDDQSDFEEEGISSTIIHGNTNTFASEKNHKNAKMDEYEEFYKLQKKLEREVLKELTELGGNDEEELEGMRIKRKKEKVHRIKTSSSKKNLENYDQESPIEKTEEAEAEKTKNKKEELSYVKQIADDKFKENLFKNQTLLSKITLYETNSQESNVQDSTLKKIIMINNMDLYLFKQNFVLFEKISAKIFWDHRNSKGSGDPFEKKIEFSVIGSQVQIDLVEQMFIFIAQTVNQVKKDIGIVEADITVPALFMKKLIGNNHLNL